MTEQSGSSETADIRIISVHLQLENGQTISLELAEDAPELATLFRILGSRGSDTVEPVEQFLQLPLENGRASCSFNSRQLVSIITQPPIVVQYQQAKTPPSPGAGRVANITPPGVVAQAPDYVIIDDFLTPDEHRDMLKFALGHEEPCEEEGVEDHSSILGQHKVISNFAATDLSRVLGNRLLTWLPLISSEMALPLFPLRGVESQLSVSNDGHYYRAYSGADAEGADHRDLTCVYYFFREPRPFSGGALRLHDSLVEGGQSGVDDNYRDIEAVSNRLVVFRSSESHEFMRLRCPSRQFADSRFAVTHWIHASPDSRLDDTFGWGHLQSAEVASQLSVTGGDTL